MQERYSESEREARLSPRPEEGYFNFQWLKQTLQERALIMISEGANSQVTVADAHAEHLGLEVGQKTNLSKNQELADALQLSRHKEFPFKPLADEVLRSRALGLDVGIVVSQSQRLKRVTELLSTYSVNCEPFDGDFFEWRKNLAGQNKGRINLLQGHVSSGFKAPAAGFQLIHESEIFPEISSRRTTLSAKNVRRFLGTVSQLKENDYIVHIDHGVGMYRGLKQLQVEGKMAELLHLEQAARLVAVAAAIARQA